ncbi:MAG: alpha/beta hydrolase [Hellea sp.]
MAAKFARVDPFIFSVPGTALDTNAFISKQDQAKWRLICLPGTPSQPYLFTRLLRMASEDLEVVVINRLGFHKSHSSPILNFNDQVRVVEPFLNDKRNIVLGISYGGALALTAGLNYPDSVEGIITGAALMTEPHNYARAIVGSEVFKKFEGVTPKKIRHMKAEIVGRRQQIGPLLERLRELRVPVEVLHGTLDTLVPKSDAQVLMNAIGDGARYHEIKGGTHYLELQMPKCILQALDQLISKIESKEA